MSLLHDLAQAAGLQIDWEDAMGAPQRVSDASLIAILAALGYPAGSDAAMADSLARIAQDHDSACGFLSAVVGEPLLLPTACGEAGPATLILEDGTRRDIMVEATNAGLRVPAIDMIGYHRMTLGARDIRVAIAPPRCFSIEDAVGDRRLWGPAVQIAALRDDSDSAFVISALWPEPRAPLPRAVQTRSPLVPCMRCSPPTPAGSAPMRLRPGCS